MENGNINALKGENTIPYGRVYYYYYVSVCGGGGEMWKYSIAIEGMWKDFISIIL